MSSNRKFFKDKRRTKEYDIYIAQKNTWSKALGVSEQLNDKLSNRKYVFAENFTDYIYSMFGEIASVQKNEYKNLPLIPKKTVMSDLDQFKNRFINLYIDMDKSNDEIYSEMKGNLTEMHKRCIEMNKKYNFHYQE